MKVANVTLPLLGLLFLSGNGVALAGSASALDPYAYIQAPTRAERELQQKKTKKFKVKRLKAARTKSVEESTPVAKAAPAAAPVIINTETAKAVDKVRESKPATESIKTASNDHGSGFLDGIKQSTGGIAKSTKAVGSSVVNGGKSVGSKIASGFMSAGEKVKDGTASAGGKIAVVPKKIGEGFMSTGEKVKEGGASVGAKVAGGFKTAGGSLAVLPKAVGSVASKVGGSTQDGAKKLASAPAAGLGAIGHGLSKMNPFHKDEAPVAVAQKSNDKADLKTEEQKAAKGESTETEKTASTAQDSAAEAKVAQTKADNKDAPRAEEVAQKAPAAAAETKTESIASTADTAATPASKDKDGGLRKKLAAAPKAGIEAGMAGINVTKAGVSVLSHGINKLNPFHKTNKTEAPAQATAAKPTGQDTPKPEGSAATEGPQMQLGERIKMNDHETNVESTAAGPGAVPQ